MHPPPSEVGNEVPSITTPPVSKTCNGSKQQEGGDNMEQPSHPAELYRKKVEIPMIWAVVLLCAIYCYLFWGQVGEYSNLS